MWIAELRILVSFDDRKMNIWSQMLYYGKAEINNVEEELYDGHVDDLLEEV